MQRKSMEEVYTKLFKDVKQAETKPAIAEEIASNPQHAQLLDNIIQEAEKPKGNDEKWILDSVASNEKDDVVPPQPEWIEGEEYYFSGAINTRISGNESSYPGNQSGQLRKTWRNGRRFVICTICLDPTCSLSHFVDEK